MPRESTSVSTERARGELADEELIAYACEELGASHGQLARLLGYTQPNISFIVNGRHNLVPLARRRIEELLAEKHAKDAIHGRLAANIYCPPQVSVEMDPDEYLSHLHTCPGCQARAFLRRG